MINEQLRIKIINELLNVGIFDRFLKLKNYLSYYGYYNPNKTVADFNEHYLFKNDIEQFINDCRVYSDKYNVNVVKMMFNFSKSNWNKKNRVLDKVYNIVSHGDICVFLTFTFSDDHLKNRDPKNNKKDLDFLRTALVRYLKTISDSYIANVDFGGHTDRFHFHCFCHLKDSNFITWDGKRWILSNNWFYGFTYTEVVDISAPVEAVGKYVGKLSQHSLKVKAFKSSIITNRTKKSIS